MQPGQAYCDKQITICGSLSRQINASPPSHARDAQATPVSKRAVGRRGHGSARTAVLGLLTFHFFGGILLGLWFRFGVVLAIAAAVTVEGLVAQFWLQSGPWYVISLAALMASQAGYVASAFVVSQLRPRAAPNHGNLPSGAAR